MNDNKYLENHVAHDYLDFLHNSPTPFHVVRWMEERLESIATKLDMGSDWDLKLGQSYWVTHPTKKSVIAFHVADYLEQDGYQIIASHTDSPSLHFKLNPIACEDKLIRVYPQTHGSLIYRSWLDRPIGISGAVYQFSGVSENQRPQFKTTLIDIPNVGIIPDVAIHLDREKNRHGTINPQFDLAVVLGMSKDTDQAWAKFKDLIGIPFDGLDLALTSSYLPCQVGLDKEFIVGPRQDDLAMVYASFKAFAQTPQTNAFALFLDSEETGSETAGGASSVFVMDVMAKAYHCHPSRPTESKFAATRAKSFLISADMAHALHPSPIHHDKHSPHHKPIINKGLVLKSNANDRYATTGETAAVVTHYTNKLGLKLQHFVARQDHGCGSTVGPILSTRLNIPCADLGLPMWAMHSTAETMGSKDLNDAIALFSGFYNTKQIS